MTAAAAAIDARRLKALTEKGEPKTDKYRAAIVRTVEDIKTHADERCAFYAEGGMHEAAEAWSEVAVSADYRLEQIAADTWSWA